MPESIQSFWSANEDLLLAALFAIIVCAVFWVVSSVLYRKVFPAITGRLDADKHPLAVLLLDGFRRPLALFLKLAGVCVAVIMMVAWLEHHPMPERAAAFIQSLRPLAEQILRIAAILAVTWGLVAASDISQVLLRNARHKLDLKMSKSVSRFLSAVFKVVVIAIAIAVLLKEFNYDINGLIAGLGLGGLTIALAAKDSAANFFGGLVLVTEKPFDIGDWIACSGVEGTVEDINLRSTKIRTAPGSLTIVPNAILSGAPITNWSGGMEQRRADFVLQLVYSTPVAAIKQYADEIRTLLETDPEVVGESAIVRFSELSASSLDIRVIFYTSMPGFGDHLRVRERVNYALLALAERMSIAFAYPSQSLYVHPQGDDDKPAKNTPAE